MSDGAELHTQLAINFDRQFQAGIFCAAGDIACMATADAEIMDALEERLIGHGARFANREPRCKRKVRVFGNDSFLRISQYANMAKGNKSKGAQPRHFLKEWREFRKMTQEQLAEAVGTSKSVISELESYHKGLSHKWLTRLAPSLKTTPGALLDYHPEWIDMEMLGHFLGIEADERPTAIKILRQLKKTA